MALTKDMPKEYKRTTTGLARTKRDRVSARRPVRSRARCPAGRCLLCSTAARRASGEARRGLRAPFVWPLASRPRCANCRLIAQTRVRVHGDGRRW